MNEWKLKEVYKSGAAPATDRKRGVTLVVADTWDLQVTSSSGHVLLLLYSTAGTRECGRDCEQFEQNSAEFAIEIERNASRTAAAAVQRSSSAVTCAKMDVDDNDVPDEDSSLDDTSRPALFFKAHNEKPVRFEGPKTLQALRDFLLQSEQSGRTVPVRLQPDSTASAKTEL